MLAGATDGTCLAKLVKMAIPLLRAAQRQCPRTGPGRLPDYDDWKIAVMIMSAVMKKRKSKSAQYRFLYDRRVKFKRWLGLKYFPARSTYFDRYRQAHALLSVAIELHGRQALREGVASARSVAVDKSLLGARGPLWNHKDRKANRIPKGLCGVDRDSTWGYSPHHGWVQGYSYEVVVTAEKGTTLPLLASAGTASVSEHVSFEQKIPHLPPQTQYVLADSGYDNNRYGDAVEWDAAGHRTGRRYLCPAHRKNNGRDEGLPIVQRDARRRRDGRLKFYASPEGRRRYARRSQSVEPFNEWLKNLFGMENTVWHRGLSNNQTQLLAAIFAYQLLLRYNLRQGRHNGEIQWILDTL
jgi:hypothetical protein